MTNPQIEKLDNAAAGAVRRIAVKNPEGAYHGIVPPETMAFLYEHVALLGEELVKGHLAFGTPPQITLGVDRHNRRQLGHFKVGRDALGLKWRIDMNVLHLNRPKADVIRTLLHEILHALQEESGKPAKGNYHNTQFRGWCETLGIPTDVQGHDKGTTPGGLYDRYAKRHKLDGVAKLVPPKVTPKAPGSKLKKWICQGCDEPQIARIGKDDFRATCDDCGTEFVEVTR